MHKKFSFAVDTLTNSHSSIQHDQLVHVCDIEMVVDVQSLEKSTYLCQYGELIS